MGGRKKKNSKGKLSPASIVRRVCKTGKAIEETTKKKTGHVVTTHVERESEPGKFTQNFEQQPRKGRVGRGKKGHVSASNWSGKTI